MCERILNVPPERSVRDAYGHDGPAPGRWRRRMSGSHGGPSRRSGTSVDVASRGLGRLSSLWAAAAMGGLSLVWSSRVWMAPQRRTLGYGGDSHTVIWCLGWYAHALSHAMSPMTSTAVRVPGGINLMWQTGMPLLGVLLAPLTWAAGPVVSFNVIATAAPALSGWAAFCAFRRWVRPVPAFCGGVFFAFSPFMTVQSSQHPFLTFLPSAPLLLLTLDRLCRSTGRAWVTGAGLGGILGCQFLISEEIFAAEVVVAVVLLGLLSVLHRDAVAPTLTREWRTLGLAAGTSAALVAWPLYAQFTGRWRVTQQLHPSGRLVTDLLGFVVPSRPLLVNPAAAGRLASHLADNWTEYDSYVGIPLLLVLVAYGHRYWRRPGMRLGAALWAVPAVVALGPSLRLDGRDLHLPLPWYLGAHLPVLRDLLPTRVAGLMFLGVALMLAVAVDGLSLDGRLHRRIGYAVLAMVAVSVSPRWPYAAQHLTIPRAFASRQVCAQQNVVAVVLPFQNDTLSWQAAAGFCYRTPESVNFNAAGAPPGGPLIIELAADRARYGKPLPAVTAEVRWLAFRQLRSHEVTEVVLGPSEPHSPRLLHHRLALWVTDLLAEAPRHLDGAEIWTVDPASDPLRQMVVGRAGE